MVKLFKNKRNKQVKPIKNRGKQLIDQKHSVQFIKQEKIFTNLINKKMEKIEINDIDFKNLTYHYKNANKDTDFI